MWCDVRWTSGVQWAKQNQKQKMPCRFQFSNEWSEPQKKGKETKSLPAFFSFFIFLFFFKNQKWRKRKKDKILLDERIKPKSWTRGRIIFFQNIQNLKFRVFAWHAVTRICGNFNNSAENFSLKFVRVYMWVEIPWKTDIWKSTLATSSHKRKRSGKATKDIASTYYLL